MTSKKLTPRKIKSRKPYKVKDIGIDFLLLVCASVLFALSFPNFLFTHGSSIIVVFALIPISIVVRRAPYILLPFYGFFYGNLAYMLFNIWLYKFAPAAFLVVPPIYGSYFLWVFILLKLADSYFQKYSYLVQGMVWLFYEYIKNTGFLAYAFGTLGYAWSFKPRLIQSASVFGVWGITLFIATLSFYFAYLCNEYIDAKKNSHQKTAQNQRISGLLNLLLKKKIYYIPGLVLGFIFMFLIIVGTVQIKNIENQTEKALTERVALTQHVLDPWKGGFAAYKHGLELLIAQSREVLESDNPPKLIVWSETAFVPSIAYHLKYRDNSTRLRLILELLDFFDEYPETEFLIGNGEGVKIKNENSILERMDYNAAILYKARERLDYYYKINLVPFTESFPYKKLFPRIYNFLLENDTHFWLAGKKYTVFKGSGFNFSTPICFEDGFPAQNAKFIRNGADVLINITNDAWSGMEINEYQHFALSIMRAVENRRSVLRSTNAGITAVIRPSGRIQSILPAFKRAILVDDVPIYNATMTIFTKYPNWFLYLVFGIFSVFIIIKIVEIKLKPKYETKKSF